MPAAGSHTWQQHAVLSRRMVNLTGDVPWVCTPCDRQSPQRGVNPRPCAHAVLASPTEAQKPWQTAMPCPRDAAATAAGSHCAVWVPAASAGPHLHLRLAEPPAAARHSFSRHFCAGGAVQLCKDSHNSSLPSGSQATTEGWHRPVLSFFAWVRVTRSLPSTPAL